MWNAALIERPFENPEPRSGGHPLIRLDSMYKSKAGSLWKVLKYKLTIDTESIRIAFNFICN